MSFESSPLPKDDAEKKILDVLDDMFRNQRGGMMNVPPKDGRLLRLLAESINAKHVVEIGTSNGYSGLWILLALHATGGKLTTHEIDAERAALAREKAAGSPHYRRVDPRFQEGLDLLDAGQSARALAFFDRAIESEPEHPDAYFCRGLVHHEAGRHREAIADLDQAIELHPEHPYAHFQRGFVYHQMEQHEQAMADLTRAIEIRPDEWAYALRSAVHANLGQQELAEADHDRSARLSPRANHE